MDTQEFSPEFLEKVKNDMIKNARERRNELLDQSDKYLLPDFPITPENLILIKEYRQKLRDFSNNNFIIPDFPF